MATSTVTLLLFSACLILFGVEGKSCPDGFVKNGRNCYWFSNMQATFAEAVSMCGFFKSQLATIKSADEDAFIRKYATDHGRAEQYFIGGTDVIEEGTWLLSKGQPMKYVNWGPNEPNNMAENEHCVGLLKKWGYKFNDDICTKSVNFICQK